MFKTIVPYATALVMLLVMGGFPAACGKKGPPVPPEYHPPAVPQQLHHQVVNDTLTLRWKVPETGTYQGRNIAGAAVYRFKRALADTSCQECPPSFSLIQKIPFESNEMRYTETLAKGYRYFYKVVFVDTHGRKGEDANVIEFAYE